MPMILTIAIDWDRNSSYIDTYDDVTNRVISAHWFLGMREAWQDAADNSLLDHSDQRYSPEYASSPLNGKVKPFKPYTIIF